MKLPSYIGTKIIQATPMNRGDYNILRGWKLPKNENGADEGYLVIYPDSESNHPDYAGYVSWSPKEQFEAAYTQLPYESPEAFVTRMIGELVQLQEKVSALGSFLKKQAPSLLSQTELELLQAQYAAMKNYEEVLTLRINLYVKAEVVENTQPEAPVADETAPLTSDEGVVPETQPEPSGEESVEPAPQPEPVAEPTPEPAPEETPAP